MSFEIDAASVQHYTTNIQLLLQQKGSLLKDTVSTGKYTGKAAKAIEQIGAVTAGKVDVRHGDTPLSSTPHTARWVFPNDYIWADLIDDQDKLRLLIDPTSSYALNGAYAIGRAMDDEILAAFMGVAKTGENGSEAVKFPGAQVVTDSDPKALTGMTVDKLQQAIKRLRQAEVDLDHDPVYCAISAQQEQDLLKDPKITSRDFNTQPVLVDGKLRSFMGISFVPIQRLSVDGLSKMRICPLWSKSGMHLGLWDEVSVSIDRRPDKRNSMQVMVKGTFGATRTHEQKVVSIYCKE